MSDRLSRKEIKRDELLEAVEKTVGYASSHRRGLVYGVVAVVVLAVVAVGVFFYLESRARKASVALDRAMEVYAAQIDPDAPRPEDPETPTFADEAARKARARELFAALRKDFSGTDASAVATAFLGRMAADEGKLDEARALWEDAADAVGDRMFSAEIRLNLLKLDIAEGDPGVVAQRLEAMLEQAERPMPEDMILFHLAELREKLGRTDEALAAYQRIVDEFPTSPYTVPAREKVSSLEGA